MENRVILLVGPTCVGKTETAVLLAEKLGTQIISADSMQIYRHMDVGTEKPSHAQRRRARHHMIDVVDPWESFSSGRYIEAVTPIIKGLNEKGEVPIIAGGTGLYIKAMTRGLFRGPGADWALREKLLEKNTEKLYGELKGLDPAAAAEVMPTDKRRIIRALEICLKSGRRVSDLRKELTSPLPYEFIKIALTRDRKELYRMIEERVDGMLERGLLDEVKALLAMNPDRTPLQAIGYKEVAAHLRGEFPLEEAVRLVKRNTKRYAKRQFTWFNREPDLNWVDITGVQDASIVLDKMRPILKMYHIGI